MPKIILVGGGSASGKTYVTESVIKNLDSSRITHLSLDDYYKDQSNISMEERMKVNYDHPKAFDWKLMESQLIDLKMENLLRSQYMILRNIIDLESLKLLFQRI